MAAQWASILENDGSVQHLRYLTDTERATFKTCFELDQHWVVRHAGDRQPSICQGQSVNLFFAAGTPRKVVNSVHLMAYRRKLKGLYYNRVTTGASAEKVNAKIERVALGDAAATAEECTNCHG
jgi:ribonucleoside-diphosphate reductase alpha chain